jgi:peptidoglycan/xylan/chitin deacetylase (PgdA/CDA1 family)
MTAAQLRRQLARTDRAIEQALPTPVCLFRPPYGEDVPRLSVIAAKLGLTTILWSIDPSDYALTSPREIAGRVLSHAQPGAIVVLHDGGANRSPTVQALPMIIRTLERRGYRLVTISTLLANSTAPTLSHRLTSPSE